MVLKMELRSAAYKASTLPATVPEMSLLGESTSGYAQDLFLLLCSESLLTGSGDLTDSGVLRNKTQVGRM